MQLRVTLIQPNGEGPPPQQQQIYFEGEDDRGVDLSITTKLRVPMPGVYWFVVELDDQLVTKIPWRIIYSPVITRTRT